MEKWSQKLKRRDLMHEKIYSSEQVLLEGKKLAVILQNLPEVIYFQKCEEKLRNHKEVKQLLQKVKRLQKEVINLQHIGKTNACKQKEVELQVCQDQLHAIPLVTMFFQAQEEVNTLFQNISSRLTQAVNEEMKKSCD